MRTLRVTGILFVALMTMGSGVVTKQTDEQPKAVILEPEYVDEEPTTKTSEAVEAEADEAITDASASAPEDEGDGIAPVPPTPIEMAGEGTAIEVALSDDYIQGRYYTGGGILGFDDATGHVGVYFSDNRDVIGNIGLMSDRVSLFKDFGNLSLSVGARTYVALLSDPDDDVVGLAPGIEGRYGLPFDFPLALVGNFFYSPDVLTLGDAEDIIDLDLRVEAEVIPDIVGFIGFREFQFDSDEGSNKDVASEIQLGARFSL